LGIKIKFVFLVLLVLFLVACEGNKMSNENLPQLQEIKNGEIIAVLETDMGDIKLRFFSEYAPKSVENFLTHAKEKYYDGVLFHRVIKDFMIQTGDPSGTGRGGESIWGEKFKNEVSNNLFHIRGAVSMANAGPDTNGSQFFIVQNKIFDKNLESYLKAKPKEIQEYYRANGGCCFLDMNYSVFAQVFDGMDIVDKIASMPVDQNDRPLEKIKINNIKLLNYKN